MPTKQQTDDCYMQCAQAHAALSKAQRAQVGCVFVTPKGVVIGGVNGLPTALGNECEYRSFPSYDMQGNLVAGSDELVTKREVLHAEIACLLRAAKEGLSVEGSSVYVTLSPCAHCASMLIAAGVSEVIYKERYRDPYGLILLEQAGIIHRLYNQGD